MPWTRSSAVETLVHGYSLLTADGRLKAAPSVAPRLSRDILAEQAELDAAWYMLLEARTFEPLNQMRYAIVERLDLWFGDRLAEQRQAFGIGLATLAVEFEAIGAPVAQERLTQAMPGSLEIQATLLRHSGREAKP